MNDTGQVHHYDTRELARKLDAYPTPLLANVDPQDRGHCSRSTVDRIRKAHGLRSDGPRDSRPVFNLLAILEFEGMPDLLVAWVLGADDDRIILTAPLLSKSITAVGSSVRSILIALAIGLQPTAHQLLVTPG